MPYNNWQYSYLAIIKIATRLNKSNQTQLRSQYEIQAIVLASFLVMPYALADDQGGLKQDAAPPPPHAIEDGYRGTDDAKKMTVDFAKNMHDGASVSLRGNLISHKGEDRYVFRDKSGEINVVIPAAVFDGREVQPDQMINISGSLDKKSAPAVVRVTHLQK
ncbi:stress response protein [Escherichia coli]|uniref:Stress response protein n=16 Tax=root TaxID=1 RepID=A0A377HAN3_ECOLX|nr:stress response protein [Escherichia coli]STO39572.1 stress response protein [Escherichia coli]